MNKSSDTCILLVNLVYTSVDLSVACISYLSSYHRQIGVRLASDWRQIGVTVDHTRITFAYAH